MNGDLLLSNFSAIKNRLVWAHFIIRKIISLMEPGNHNLILLNHLILIIVSPEDNYICPTKSSLMMGNVSALSENVSQIISWYPLSFQYSTETL